ncbi:MAG TPA: cytochrome oxidase small assembly protein [Burkholderiaceae bacterium]|nr:cytochrome oxidase small assembly protein [Burkholderiaceae bacterium]
MTAAQDQQKRNRRTLWILLSIVLVFFLGIIVRRWLFG